LEVIVSDNIVIIIKGPDDKFIEKPMFLEHDTEEFNKHRVTYFPRVLVNELGYKVDILIT